ncbi:group 3 secretory phospholipase A2-like [Xyrichtys novacula]|uniref:phospholipase A2 n=1 Tax=Xyrichtys novacula TaxID=13765 RepID=A0AAV1G366_XYRNO|nr:group 3 secretory phospholipase A2-like [Xyrichtys novacula]
MRGSRCPQQLLLFFSSLIFSKVQDVMGSGLSCVRSSPAGDGRTRVSFLREDSAGARSLYLSLWSEDAQLLTCDVNQSPLVTGNYRSLCDRSGTREEELSRRFDISALLAPESPCARGSSSGAKFSKRARGDGTAVRSRKRRGMTFPGTLWCGTGSAAAGFDELGMFESADRCCREHDHCKHNIPAFTMNYGVFNSKFYTVSHCDCDQRFRQCLLKVNDTISSMVGYSFFNVIQVPCFELKPQKRCTKMYWWGLCKSANVAPYAVFKSPLPYNSSDPANKHADNTNREKVTRTEKNQATKSPKAISTKSPKSDQRCSDPPRGDTFQHKRKGKGCRGRQRGSTVAPVTTKVNTTSPERKTHPSKNSTAVSNQKRAGKKKSSRQRLSANTDRVTTNPFLQTTQRTPSSTQNPAFHTHAPTAATKTNTSRTKSQKPGLCCGLRTPLRGDAFQPRCKKCAKHQTASQTTTAAPSETTPRLPENQRLTKTTEGAKEDTSRRPLSRGPSSKTNESETLKMKTSHWIQKKTNQESMNQTTALNTPVMTNLTDPYLLCASLKHLDDCRYKIAPQENKFDLQNTETKTAYHCDCTSRLALHIQTFSQPGVLLSLLKDFVSPDCFRLPEKKKKEKCHNQKSCSGGFTKASDLLQALKKIEGRDTAGVRNSVSDRKRGIPVRLWKRCLRLQREADIMAQLTRL